MGKQGGERRAGCVDPLPDDDLTGGRTLGRVVAAAVIAAVSEEAGRVVTPGEVLAVVRAMQAPMESAGKSEKVKR